MKTCFRPVVVVLLSACNPPCQQTANGKHKGLVDRFDSRAKCQSAARRLQDRMNENGAVHAEFCKRARMQI